MKRDSQEATSSATSWTSTSASTNWTYLSNHAHVLVCLARDPEVRLRDIALMVGITERGVSRILSELEESGVIEKKKVGRRNHYELHLDAPLRHPLESHATVADLIDLLCKRPRVQATETAVARSSPHRDISRMGHQ